MKKLIQILGNTLLPLVILVLVIVQARSIISSRPQVDRAPAETPTPSAEVQRPESRQEPLTLRGSGEVKPARIVRIGSQVAGEVVEVLSPLSRGTLIAEGTTIARLDSSDYRLAVDDARNAIARAETSLALERGRNNLAAREWELTDAELDPEHADLALRVPQLEAAELGVAQAELALRRARVGLGRTRVDAPFDGVVLEDNVELGMYAAPGVPMLTLVSTDSFHVEVPVNRQALESLRELLGSDNAPLEVQVSIQGADRTHTRAGRVIAILPDLTPLGRMGQVLVEVPDPLGLATSGSYPLHLGSYVQVEFPTEHSGQLYGIPRRALRENNELWLARDGRLARIRVDVVWEEDTKVWVRGPITSEDWVVLTNLISPVDGMPLNVQEQEG